MKLAAAWEAVDAQQGLTSDRPTGDSVCHILPDVTEYLRELGEHHRHSLGISTRDDELFSELALDQPAARTWRELISLPGASDLIGQQ